MSDNSFRHLLQMLLEYLGLSSYPNQLGYHGDAKRKERKRWKSLIRTIGSHLPLKPCRRVYFQTLQDTNFTKHGRKPTFIDDECEPLPMATLADIPWIEVFSPDKSSVARTEYRGSYKRSGRRYRPVQLVQPVQKETCSDVESTTKLPKTPVKEMPTIATPDPVSMRKIDALEEELSKLRAQIALIVTTQQSYPATPGPAIPPPMFGAPPPPPPPCGAPPPPPPPPPAVIQTKHYSVKDQIKKNKALKGNIDDCSQDSKSGVPNMADVLKGLGSVKLRSIARSPGGTPVRQAPKLSNSMDAASLIAQALKKKFAHRLAASPNKENNPRTFTPSPKSPKVGQQLLKPHRRRSITKPRPLKPINA
ncbi:mitochondrial fission regulator 2-like [Antedon mediterranea]|uniref:mitochondrial fission regulator 2-like n=1 Tax=Antedon mediterranea TaxID=105859 RepID=UPI003AF61D47